MKKNSEKALEHIKKFARTKDGEVLDQSLTINQISALSLYFMTDKNVWQLKLWLYPTNRSKTYNLPIEEKHLQNWIQFIKSIAPSGEDDLFNNSEEGVETW